MNIEALKPRDGELMVLISRGDVRAFEQFFDRHSAFAFALALRILNDRGMAADASQAAFLDLWHDRGAYKAGPGAGRSWLLGRVRHRALGAQRHVRVPRGALGSELHVSQPPASGDIDGLAIGTEAERKVRSKLEQLPLDQRRVIELAYFNGLTHTEIAKQLELPVGTAKRRMRRALDTLRAALNEHASARSES